MNERQGLYSHESSVSSPLAPSANDETQLQISSINPHRIFFKVTLRRLPSFVHRRVSLQFIEERVYLSMHQSDLEMEILVTLFEKSLSAVPMSRDINAIGLRFRVLSLSLYLVQSGALKSAVAKTLLREKIYQVAFDYFT